MGAPVPEFERNENASAEALLASLKTITASERRKHATVFSYWLSIRGDRKFPPIRDLDPLEISDAGPFSLLLEMVGGGEDADIRHFGQAINGGLEVEKIGDAPKPSLLACIASRLPVVAATAEAFAFEDKFDGADGETRCWVTLLPFSTSGTLIDFVYGFVSLDPSPWADADAEEPQPETIESEPEEDCYVLDESAVVQAMDPEPEAEVPTAEAGPQEMEQPEGAPEEQLEAPAEPAGRPGFSAKISESLKNLSGFYGHVVEVETGPWTVEPVESAPEVEMVEPVPEEEPVASAPEVEMLEPAPEEETVEPSPEVEMVEPAPEPEIVAAAPESAEPASPLQARLADVRARADEARQAKLRSNVALYEGLGAAYDFALDAEGEPEDYLKLVEARGLKIQLRSPMKPVVKLAFDGLCDDSTIAQLEAVLAWALKEDMPRGSLAERIQAEGGIGSILAKLDYQS